MLDYFEPPVRRVFPKGWRECSHWREPVCIGRYVVTCSSLFAGARAKTDGLLPPPDYGIYLAGQWREKLGDIWTNGATIRSVARERPYPALVIDWMDMAGMTPDKLNQLVEICRNKMRQGKSIDIGCLQGHGRSGTLLACLLARVEHLSAARAVEEVHWRYCQHAVETQSQQKAVEEYVRQYGIRRR
ncbi:MAG: hypothetical protein Q8O16_02325 [Dehalococcoidia bacterium]|nr:hypothetical protein [Dehalococcoidia bacterium]